MKKAFFMLCLAALAVLSLSCGTSEDKPFAMVGGEALTSGMLIDQYLAISPEARPELATLDEQEQFAH